MKKVIHSVGTTCGYLAALTNLVAFIWYGIGILYGTIETNPVTWYLWLAETAISLTLYADRTQDRSKWLAEAVSMLGVVVVTVYLTWQAVNGHEDAVFETVEWVDAIPTTAAIFAFGVWLATRKKYGAGVGLWFFQIALLAAIVPLVRATYADPSVEPFGPWALWTCTFVLQSLCAGLKWDGFDTLASPINYAITHGAVAWIIWQSATSC